MLHEKKNLLVFLLFLTALIIVFPDIFTLQGAFLSGDHRDQQFPWAKFYQDTLRQGRLPWWTSQIHCGFPLLAEGQIGAFYPLNFLFFYFLPLKWAYNYIILFQYLLGGALFYFYMLRLGISRWGSFFASLIYLFGSSQGGYFYYNYISQKTVIWLPLTLILIDRLTEKQKGSDSFWLAIVFAIQIFAGYLQVAIYSILFSSVYFLGRLKTVPSKAKPLALFAASGLLALFFSMVQLAPTYELARFSSRAFAPAGLAYVGSMLPIGFMTLFYPSWDGFLGSEWYLGLPGLFFAGTVFFYKWKKGEGLFVFLAGFFLLLALGGYSPLYRGIVGLTHFQGFRTPIKFLFFVTFSCAVLAGFGFDRFFESSRQEKKKGTAFFQWAGIYFLAIPWLISAAAPILRPRLLPLFERWVIHQYYGRPGHPHPLEVYREKAVQFYDQASAGLSFADPSTRQSFILIIIFLGLLFIYQRLRLPHTAAKIAITLFLFLDLFLYGFTSIRPNILPYSDWEYKKGGIVDYLLKNGADSRVSAFAPLSEMEKLPFYPNSNMLYGFSDPGAYSPLVMKAYRDRLSPFLYINDSLSAGAFEGNAILTHLNELSLLNVRYLVSRLKMTSPDLELVLEEKGNFLYRNRRSVGRAFFIPGNLPEDILLNLSPETVFPAVISKAEESALEISFEVPTEGWLFISQIDYPQWQAEIDGRPTEIHKAGGLFQALQVLPGRHTARLQYQPGIYQKWGTAGSLAFFLLLGPVLLKSFNKAKKPGLPC